MRKKYFIAGTGFDTADDDSCEICLCSAVRGTYTIMIIIPEAVAGAPEKFADSSLRNCDYAVFMI